MADTVSKQDNAHFLNQAKLHRDSADHTRQMLSQAQVLHDNMTTAVQGSSISDILPDSTDWWDTLNDRCLHYIDLHEQMADHLEKTASAFDQTDTNVSTDFSS